MSSQLIKVGMYVAFIYNRYISQECIHKNTLNNHIKEEPNIFLNEKQMNYVYSFLSNDLYFYSADMIISW